jgi:hypothetical protein
MTVDAFMMPFSISMSKIDLCLPTPTGLYGWRTRCPVPAPRAATMPPDDASLRWSDGDAVPTVCETLTERW